MKKGIVLILSILYLGSSSGATLHLHYCMNKLVGWDFQANTNKCGKCSTCGMEKVSKNDKDCCKDEHKQVKIDDDHRATAPVQLQHFTSPAIVSTWFDFSVIRHSYTTGKNPISHAPPQNGGIPVFIRNCVFRI